MRTFVKNWLEAAIEAVIIIVILYFLCFPVKVEGSSMEDTLWNHDRVAICRIMAMVGAYETGDIVVFQTDLNGQSEKLVKRVIAKEGDTITIEDGCVWLNGTLLDETYAKGVTEGSLSLTVPEGEIFVMGDNREHSTDSRSFGTISEKDVQGKVLVRFYPLNQIAFYF